MIQLRLDIGRAPDFNALADLILTALYDGYGARGHTPAVQCPVRSARDLWLQGGELSGAASWHYP